ncbi:MAG: hypothetical protein HS107_07860 [Thermoflexaceae bacterium]|nr:hypothetical protein [Thermoflexaceae bacterium]
MRLLAIGYPLPHPEVDNYNVFTAPSYFDYDAVFIDPVSITRAVAQLLDGSETFEAFDGRPVVNAPTTASAVSAADLVRRRLEETQRFLESGGAVVVLARPNATISGLSGFEGCDRYSWLPAPGGVSWNPPMLRAAEGKTVRVVDDQHPLAGVLRNFRSEVAYRAVFDDRNQALRQAGRILGTGGAGVPIAMEFPVLGGRVVFAPALSDAVGATRLDLAEAVVGATRLLIGQAGQEEAPWWTASVPVPGLEQVEAELEEARQAASDATARESAVRERHDLLAAHRRLLWAEGPAFAEAVANALTTLGFAVTGKPGEPLAMENEGRVALVECESSKEQVVEWPYVRLQRRLEERLLAEKRAEGGVVVVNGYRAHALESRGEQFTEALRVACENYRYSLISGETLFALVQRALGGADEAALSGIRRRILGRAGLLPREVALGEVEEESDTGPIF